MAHTLPELPYAYDALEPHIDAKTMEIHHAKHHQAYITNLNKALEGTDLADKPVEELIRNIDNAAREDPHRGPQQRRRPRQPLAVLDDHVAQGRRQAERRRWPSAIDSDLGGFDKFKEAFTKAALTRFGSGWAWLSVDKGGKLVVESSANQDNPLMQGIGSATRRSWAWTCGNTPTT